MVIVPVIGEGLVLREDIIMEENSGGLIISKSTPILIKYGHKMNPVNSSGNIKKCSICQSIYHWFRDCPHKLDDTSTQVKLSLFTDEVYNCYINKFVGETLNHAILDNGCTKKFVVQLG